MIAATNFGHFTLNAAACGAGATIAVTSMGRSGTTMVARILKDLGLPMGDDLSAQFLEDQTILRQLKEDRMADFQAHCRTRDRDHPKWAFKCPALRLRLRAAHDIMHDPRYIVPFRDISAIAQRNHLELGTDLGAALDAAARKYSKFVTALLALDAPVLAISYEKALQYPEQTVQAIAVFCGENPEPGQIRAIAAGAIRNGDPRYLAQSGAGG